MPVGGPALRSAGAASSSHTRPVRLAVLFSGGGRTLENLAAKCSAGEIPGSIAVAISSHPGAGGVERARRLGLPCRIADFRALGAGFSMAIAGMLDEAEADLVCLAGFIRKLEVPPRLEGRVLNIHPALLPAFGGKGFYGERVHRAVLESGAKFSGCTVHYVTGEYDRGPIVLQRVVPVVPERVFTEECIAYPEAIRLHAEGRLGIEGGRVTLLPAPRITAPEGLCP
jgi:folate-dependent phosphoribosylglycinamide formyltransferase PurN